MLASKTPWGRYLCVGLCLWLLLALLPMSAFAAEPAEDLAYQLFSALEQGRSSVELRVESNNVKALLEQVFTQYPVLYYYYDGYSGTIYNNQYTVATFKLKNTQVPWNQVYVARTTQDVYNLLGYHLGMLEESFRFVMVDGPQVNSSTISQLANQLRYDNYFSYMGYHGNSASWVDNPTLPLTTYEIQLRYWEGVPLETLQQWRDAAETKAGQLARELFALDMPDYQKELRIHDWLVNNNTYGSDTKLPQSHMAYSAFVSADPVCQGYAEAALVLFQAAGIPIQYVSGTATNSAGNTENHGWNCVQIQGQWYYLDITWDDPTTSDGSAVLRYNYFNVTAEQLAKNHVWDQTETPVCDATTWNYDAVAAAVAGDTQSYTDYSDRLLQTREMGLATYSAGLQLCPKPGQAAPETEQPQQSEAAPQGAVPGTSTPGGVQPTAPQKKDAGNGWVVVVVLLALGGIAAGVVFLIKGRRPKKRSSGSIYFDPRDFGY